MDHRIYKPEQAGPVRGVLFDMDGLVLDTERLYARFWREAARELGYEMTMEQALGLRSLDDTAGQEMLERYFGPGASRERMRQIRIRRMEAYIDQNGVEPKKGIWALLDYLKERSIPTAIATSSPIERAERYLGPLGLLDRFDCVCSGRQVARGKPAPDIYLYAARCLGLSPKECIALEDSPAGIASAFQAGCRPVMIPDLDRPGPAVERMLFGLAEDLEAVIGLIEEGEKTAV